MGIRGKATAVVLSVGLLLGSVGMAAPASAATQPIPGNEYGAQQFQTREECLAYFVLASAERFCRDGATVFLISLADVPVWIRRKTPQMFLDQKWMFPSGDYHYAFVDEVRADGTIVRDQRKVLMVLPNQNTLRTKSVGTWRAAWLLEDDARWDCSVYYKDICRWKAAYRINQATVQWRWNGKEMLNGRAFGSTVSKNS